MRDDFAKVLVERPRHGHHRSFGEQRHRKIFKDDEMYYGGREPMKKRYDSWSDRKSFNEHLSPLKGWLRSVVGKQWDKSYSELRKKFDARSAINNHILEHLWDHIETHAFIEAGKVMCHVRYVYGDRPRVVPIKQCFKDYYVCPKGGTLKITNKVPKRAAKNAREIAAREAEAKVFRRLNDHQHLHFIDGTWFVFEIRDLPNATVTYRKPLNYGAAPQLFKRGYTPNGKMVPWEDLNEDERRRYGIQHVEGACIDALSGEKLFKTMCTSPHSARKSRPNQNRTSKAGPGKYYATKFTASHKILKEAGLDWTAAANDDLMLSHREAAKYRA